MDLILTRTDFRNDGIFGNITDWAGQQLFVTLEHAYHVREGFTPKVPSGDYLCVRGYHQLEGMQNRFPTYEITNVPNHTNILFHWGNYQKDSAGCILLGMTIDKQNEWWVAESRKAFAEMMRLQNGLTSFNLKVIDKR